MFVITPTSLLRSWIGHLVFGYTLGCLVNRFRPEVLKDSRQHFTEACQQTSEVDFPRLVEMDLRKLDAPNGASSLRKIERIWTWEYSK